MPYNCHVHIPFVLVHTAVVSAQKASIGAPAPSPLMQTAGLLPSKALDSMGHEHIHQEGSQVRYYP